MPLQTWKHYCNEHYSTKLLVLFSECSDDAGHRESEQSELDSLSCFSPCHLMHKEMVYNCCPDLISNDWSCSSSASSSHTNFLCVCFCLLWMDAHVPPVHSELTFILPNWSDHIIRNMCVQFWVVVCKRLQLCWSCVHILLPVFTILQHKCITVWNVFSDWECV